MREILVLAMIIALTPFWLHADTIRKEEKYMIKEARGSIDRKNIFFITVKNKEIESTSKIYAGEFFEDTTLYAIPWINNLIRQKFFSLEVVFKK